MAGLDASASSVLGIARSTAPTAALTTRYAAADAHATHRELSDLTRATGFTFDTPRPGSTESNVPAGVIQCFERGRT